MRQKAKRCQRGREISAREGVLLQVIIGERVGDADLVGDAEPIGEAELVGDAESVGDVEFVGDAESVGDVELRKINGLCV